jgi:hypothetical protein
MNASPVQEPEEVTNCDHLDRADCLAAERDARPVRAIGSTVSKP